MGLLLVFEFLAVLYIMSRRVSSKGDQGKAPVYATSHGDDSFDDETTSTGEQVA